MIVGTFLDQLWGLLALTATYRISDQNLAVQESVTMDPFSVVGSSTTRQDERHHVVIYVY